MKECAQLFNRWLQNPEKLPNHRFEIFGFWAVLEVLKRNHLQPRQVLLVVVQACFQLKTLFEIVKFKK